MRWVDKEKEEEEETEDNKNILDAYKAMKILEAKSV